MIEMDSVQSTPHIFQISISNGGVPKQGIHQAEVVTLGLAGDRHRDTEHHGGPERSVCLYSLERIQALQAEGHPVYPGAMGENVTLSGLDWSQVVPGTRLHLGSEVQVEVTRYTTPCSNLLNCFKDGNFNRVHQNRHPGWSRVYARVLQGGSIKVGDGVQVIRDA
jgi:MOSC domain-containing protein YiiM